MGHLSKNYSLICNVLVLLLCFARQGLAEDPELEFNYIPIGHVRSDPILCNGPSDHVHTFYGPPLLDPSTTTEDLLSSEPKDHSGLVEDNKSLYWHPTIYRLENNIYRIAPIHYISVYYTWDQRKTFAFPKGFRMIASDRNAFVQCVKQGKKKCGDEDGGGSKCKHNGFRTGKCVADDCDSSRFFPDRACDMLEITMDFPVCWNGELDSEDHKSHVSYLGENDRCPKSHSKLIPTVSVSIFIKDYQGGHYTWSDGTNKFHTDYLSGWEESTMNKFLLACQKDPENCHNVLKWKKGLMLEGEDSHEEKRAKLEKAFAKSSGFVNSKSIVNEEVDNISELIRGTKAECGPKSKFKTGGNPNDPTTETNKPTTQPTNKPTTIPKVCSFQRKKCKKNKNNGCKWKRGRCALVCDCKKKGKSQKFCACSEKPSKKPTAKPTTEPPTPEKNTPLISCTKFKRKKDCVKNSCGWKKKGKTCVPLLNIDCGEFNQAECKGKAKLCVWGGNECLEK